jgi:hypothetical protein
VAEEKTVLDGRETGLVVVVGGSLGREVWPWWPRVGESGERVLAWTTGRMRGLYEAEGSLRWRFEEYDGSVSGGEYCEGG